MPAPSPLDIERRALALFEHLADAPDNSRLRARLTQNEPQAVLARLSALEASFTRAQAALPTLLPDDCGAGDALPPPSRVGLYRLVERIGRGGMGEVWRGERDDGLYEQTIAVKLIQHRARAQATAAFVDERRFLARLEHPNIARLIDGGLTNDGLPFLVMEYVDGQPIDVACAALPERERVMLFVKAADAVRYAHGRMVAHADVKPANIVVRGDGRVKLLDFGIAGLIGSETPAQAGGPLTRGFASPQRVAGQGPSVADDVFALGRTLTLILGPDANVELQAIAEKAQHPDDTKRYASVDALIADLDRWKARLTVSAMPQSWRYRAGKFASRHRTGLLLTGCALTLIGAASVAAGYNFVRGQAARAEAAARFSDARGTTRYMMFGLMDQLALQPKSLALRVQVADVAQHYLDRLAESPSASPAVKLEAATGLWRLAQYQGKSGQPNLRQPALARSNLNKAEAVARALTGPAAQELLTRILLDRALLLARSDNDTEAAAQTLKQAGNLVAGMSRPAGDLRAHYLHALAEIRGWQGRYQEEVEAARRAAAEPAPEDPKKAVLFRAALIYLEAEGLFYLGDVANSVSRYRQMLALVESAHRRWPDDNFILGQMSRARWALGSALEQMNRFKESLPVLQQGLAEAQQAYAFDPSDQENSVRLRVASKAYAQNLSRLGRTDEALHILNQIAADAERDWREHPRDLSRFRDYVMAVLFVGEAENTGGRIAAGCRADERALALFDQLKAMGRLTGVDADFNIGLLKTRYAQYCRK